VWLTWRVVVFGWPWRWELRAELRAELGPELRAEAAAEAAAEVAEVAARQVEAGAASATVSACVDRLVRPTQSHNTSFTCLTESPVVMSNDVCLSESCPGVMLGVRISYHALRPMYHGPYLALRSARSTQMRQVAESRREATDRARVNLAAAAAQGADTLRLGGEGGGAGGGVDPLELVSLIAVHALERCEAGTDQSTSQFKVSNFCGICRVVSVLRKRVTR